MIPKLLAMKILSKLKISFLQQENASFFKLLKHIRGVEIKLHLF